MSITKSTIEITGTTLLEQLKSEKKKLITEKILMDKKDNHIYPIKDTPFKIPKNWVWCYLSDISIIQEGPGIRKHQYCNEGIQFLTVTNILEGEVDLEKSKKYISLDEYQKTYKHFTINYGDIVTACSGGSWGKSAIYELNEQLILNTSTLRLRFYADLGSNKYLYYLTKTVFFKDSLATYQTGQQPNYGYSHYSKIHIPLPPLSEQEHIVAILDEAFDAIAKAKANAEQNLKNAKELFESYLQGVFENGNWIVKTLGEVCEFTQGIQRDVKLQSENQKDNQVRFLRIVDFTQGNEPPRYIDNPGDKYILNSNDVSLVRYGASTGFVCRGLEGALANNLFRIIPKSKKEIINDFLFVYLTAPVFQNVIKASMNGAAMPAISFGLIKDIPFPIISIEEQQIIVQKIDALSTETKKLESIYEQKIDDLEELKKSLLQKAFNGDLKTVKALV